jgi:hypothetical protein
MFSPGIAWPEHAPLIVGGLFVTPDYSQSEEFSSIATLDPHAGGGWKVVANLSSTRTFAECALFEEELTVFGGHSGLFPTASVETFAFSELANHVSASRLRFIRSIDEGSLWGT